MGFYSRNSEKSSISGNKVSVALSNIKPCDSSEFSSKVARPHYSVLSKKKIVREFEVTVPYWRDSLKKCINKLLKENLENR